MKAAQINEYGGTDVIKIQEADKPIAGKGQVLVEVHASSINPWDTFVREGRAKAFMPLELPVTLGGDIAGVVVEVSSDVTGLAVHDRVYGTAGAPGGSGAFAEFAATNAGQLSAMPASLGFTDAAAIVLTGLSAHQVINGHIKLKSGQKILVHGGAGGIGSVAIQIAKHLGAHVATTATGNGLEFVKKLGADEVIDYKTQAFEDLIHDYDAVFDTVAGETYEKSFQVVKKGGIVVSMNAAPNAELMEKYGVTAILQQTHATTQQLAELAKYIDDGVVTVHVDKVFPLSEIAEAFVARESGQVRGKVAITIR